MIKKLLLSGLVVISFIAYSYHQTHDEDGRVVSLSASGSKATDTLAQSQANATTGVNNPSSTQSQGLYKDGSFTGSLADAFYGYVQVLAVVKGGKITDVQFLRYPDSHRNSIMINHQAMPYLTEEAIQAQSADVDIISGATDTSIAFRQSLADALAGAKT